MVQQDDHNHKYCLAKYIIDNQWSANDSQKGGWHSHRSGLLHLVCPGDLPWAHPGKKDGTPYTVCYKINKHEANNTHCTSLPKHSHSPLLTPSGALVNNTMFLYFTTNVSATTWKGHTYPIWSSHSMQKIIQKSECLR